MTYLKHTIVTLSLVALVGVSFLPQPAAAQTATLAQQQQLLALYQQLFQLQLQLNALLQQQAAQQGQTTTTMRTGPNPYFVNAITGPATRVGRNSITVQAQVDKGGSEDLAVWIQYGSGNTLNRRTDVETVTRTGLRSLTFDLTNLQSNTTYVYRVVVEDEDGNRINGETRRATTVRTTTTITFAGQPVTETEGVTNVRPTSATLQGFVSMNDVPSGAVFFVIGTDRRQVNDADRARTFNDIATARGIFNKRMVTRNFSGRNTITSTASGLQRASTYYYRVCVEYDSRGTVIRCGQTESFTTQN